MKLLHPQHNKLAAGQQPGRTRHVVRGRAAAPETKIAASADTAVHSEGSSSRPTILHYKEPSAGDQFATNFKLALALPWRRFKQGSVLVIKLSGEIAEMKQPRFSPMVSMPAICDCLRKAAYDPRIQGIYLNLDGLNAGWGKIQEIRTYLEFFKQSGKYTIAYMKRGGERDYFLASACDEIYIPPTAQLSLRGLAVSGTFLKGVLDKVGVDPQVKRIGKFKSAGDQLLRTDMADAQREQLTALLDDIYDTFVESVAKSRNKTREEVITMLDSGIYDMEEFKKGGWVTDLKYSDEVMSDLEKRTGGKSDSVAAVSLKRYQYVRPSAFGLVGRKRIAIVRAQGAILGGATAQAGQITADPLIAQLRRLAKDKSISGIVLRVDSPGGDALASDLMWRELQQLNEKKPIIAAMGDVAASGGYYMAMAVPTIVAHPLTITGSIGVVTGKFNLEELFNKVGYSKEVISRGQYAELLTDQRGFTEAEQQLFDDAAEFAYRSFRNKAAHSRGMKEDEIEEYAQGRVWSGTRAVANRLVDQLGAIDTAIALCKEACKIPEDEEVTLLEVSRSTPSPLALLSSGASLDSRALALLILTDPGFFWGTFGLAALPFLLQTAASSLLDGTSASSGQPQAVLPDVFQKVANGVQQSGIFPQASMPSIDVKASSELSSSAADMLGDVVKTIGLHR